jgi:uncharacterized membrane protein YvbJ
MSKFFTCPNCGADVPLKALACPECGSDKDTGWSEAAKYTHLMPDRGDMGWGDSRSRAWQKPAIAIIAVLIITGFVASQGLAWYVVPAIAIAATLTYVLVQRYSNSRWGMERKLYQQLLSKSKGDKKLAARLLEYEQKRNPYANRLQNLQNAVFHYDRDRR